MIKSSLMVVLLSAFLNIFFERNKMKQLKHFLLLSMLLCMSVGANAASLISAPTRVAANVISPPFDVVPGGLIVVGDAYLYDAFSMELGKGTIDPFTLDPGSVVTGTFTSAMGTYTVSGAIDVVTPFSSGVFFFAGLELLGGFDFGSISAAPGSSSLDLSVIDYDFAPVPVPSAFWLFGSAFFGLAGLQRRNTAKAK